MWLCRPIYAPITTEEEELTEEEKKKSFRDDIEKNWRLIIHDDEVNELDEVPDMITEVRWHNFSFVTSLSSSKLNSYMLVTSYIVPEITYQRW